MRRSPPGGRPRHAIGLHRDHADRSRSRARRDHRQGSGHRRRAPRGGTVRNRRARHRHLAALPRAARRRGARGHRPRAGGQRGGAVRDVPRRQHLQRLRDRGQPALGDPGTGRRRAVGRRALCRARHRAHRRRRRSPAVPARAGAVSAHGARLAETAFTLSHTLSFSASALGWVRVSAPAAEACIAVSLVLVALDAGRAARDASRRAPGDDAWKTAGLAFAFGLVHGLGFAGGLTEIGLPSSAVPAALIGFAAGVEIGQVAFLAIALAVLAVLERAPATGPRGERRRARDRRHRLVLVARAPRGARPRRVISSCLTSTKETK
jgi:hypothetical protein